MEGCRRRGLLAPSALPGKAAAGGGRKPPACREDNVLGGHAVEATSFAPARPEEYRKVFGAASACSIPVLDLPSASDGCGCLGFSALDYVDIFGGFDGRDFGVPYEELFFAATEESSGTGEPPSPLPAPDDTAPLSANTCISRRSKEMSRLTHEIPLPEWPGGDSIGSSLSRVVHHLSDGTKQTNLSDHTASWNSKDDPVHGEIHKNQVHAISISTNFVEHTKTNIPDIQVVTDICLYSSGSKETMKGQHLKKTVVSTSCSSAKHPQIDMKAEPRPPKSEFCASRIALYEQNESLISSNQSMVSRSNVASANFSNNHSLHEDFVEKKTEGKWQNDTAQSTFMISTEKLGGSKVETSIRCKARMERHQRTVERMIIGPESGWQPIPLTDVITASAVKKAYRKAMLYIHPDKIQQRSASVQQKYICEKVFDLLQEARNKFHSEEW